MNARILELESSQLFAKQAGKTQVLITTSNQKDIYRTRQTHVYEVRTISLMIAEKVGFDKKQELAIVSMSHDIGHPPFGHEGAKVLNKAFKAYGLNEGFSDNNNNLQMIEQNVLSFSDYELVSLIKYPKKLYKDQKLKYLRTLERFVTEESKVWGKKLKRTVACNIMDISDEIAYITSDLYDSYSTGFISGQIISKQFKILSDKYKSQPKLFGILNGIGSAALNGYKRVLREEVFQLKMFLINDTFWDYELANLTFKSKEAPMVMKDIFSFTMKNFIHNEKVLVERDKASKKLINVIDFFLNNDSSEFPSDMYREKFISANSKEERLRVVRDMISDTTDNFILNFKGK